MQPSPDGAESRPRGVERFDATVESLHEGGDDARVEMAAGLSRDDAPCFVGRTSLSVGAVGDEDVIGVGDRDHAGLDQNRVSNKPMRIAASVHPLVVIEHTEQLTLELAGAAEDGETD